MASPSKLHRLHRFFRHEEDGSKYACFWNVAAGALEKRQRLYRVFYESSTVKIQDEITINVKAPEVLKDFFFFLRQLLVRSELDPAFQQACRDLLTEDPWLSMFTLSAPSPPTNSHLQHDIETADAVSA